MRLRNKIVLIGIVASVAVGCSATNTGIVAEDARLEQLLTGFRFTEGPVVDDVGNLYFVDILNSRIHKWSEQSGVSVYLDNTGKANGLAFDKKGNLLACSGGDQCIVSIDPKKKKTVVIAKYKGKKLNSPNDLWVDPLGGIYFTDPRYWDRTNMEMGEHVYYLAPDRESIRRVIDDFKRPNGIVGTPDGKKLYVADRDSKKTWAYDIGKGGMLLNKRLFAEVGSDGMTIDNEGNVYMTGKPKVVVVCDPTGRIIDKIQTPEMPTNLCFGSRGEKRLYITACKSIYVIKTRVSAPR